MTGLKDLKTCYQDVTSDQDNEADIRLKKYLYVDVLDELTPNVPKPRGQTIHINFFMDSDNAGDRVYRCFKTCMLLYFNITPIILYSERQNTLES